MRTALITSSITFGAAIMAGGFFIKAAEDNNFLPWVGMTLIIAGSGLPILAIVIALIAPMVTGNGDKVEPAIIISAPGSDDSLERVLRTPRPIQREGSWRDSGDQ
jgi:hypothetical protein